MVKIYGSYGGLFVFKLLDDYRVCVKKRNFYRPPSDATSGDAWRCELATCGRYHLRIGGNVVSYVEYVIAALYEDAEKKFVVLAAGF